MDGIVADTWSRQRRGKRVDVHVEPLAALRSEQRRHLAAEVERVAHFLETDVGLSFVGR